MFRTILVAGALALTAPALVLAQEDIAEVEGLERSEPTDVAAFALNYGANFTSNYISDGETQSDDNPAVQGYVEGSYGLFYGGIWASTVDYDSSDQVEFDLYAGIRPSFGDLSVDLNYTRYLYDDTGDCCGEFGLILGYPMSDIGATLLAANWDPEENTYYTEVGAAVYFAEVWELGGTVGTDYGTGDYGVDDKVDWDLGVTRGIGNYASLDLRYHDSNYDPGTGVVSLAFDF